MKVSIRCRKCYNTVVIDSENLPLHCCGIRYDINDASSTVRPPSLLQRAKNLARDSTAHILNDRRIVDDATRQWRLSQCESCTQFFDPNKRICTHIECGCYMHSQRTFFDALGWASKRCPINRWQYNPITKRNLIYHVCALETNDLWLMNCRQLLSRINVFNGKKIIAIATGEGILKPSVVKDCLNWRDCEFIEVPNCPELREVASFRTLLDSVCNTNCDEATFYAHTKGNSTKGNRVGATYWRNAMYDALLSESKWQICMNYLRDYAAVGCHKRVWLNKRPPYPSGLKRGKWFFGGTFFWFRNDIIFGNPKWTDIPQDRYGAEAWLSGFIEHWQVCSVFQLWDEQEPREPDYYNPASYTNPITDKPVIPSTEVICPANPEPKTVVVLGCNHSGTSSISKMLWEMGAPTLLVSGEGVPYDPYTSSGDYSTFEDYQIMAALKKLDVDLLKSIIDHRNQKFFSRFNVWHFKWPGSMGRKESVKELVLRVIKLLINPHLVIVSRDVLATYQSAIYRQEKSKLMDVVTYNHQLYQLVNSIYEERLVPALLVSYERSLSNPHKTAADIKSFISPIHK